MQISSLKKLKQLHQSMGGNKRGYYIIVFGNDIATKKPITVRDRIAYHAPRQANWSYQLVSGKYFKPRKY